MLPTGISTTQITFGTALTNVKRLDLGMKVTFTPTSNLVWAATGTVIIALPEAAASGSDGNGSIELIDPWQTGFVDGNGNQIINWGYSTTAEYTAGGQTILKTPEKIITWGPDDPGPIDLDLLVPVPAQSGIIVYLPDAWSADIANLQTRVTALEHGGGGGGGSTSALVGTALVGSAII
jgi:hypothetical protein